MAILFGDPFDALSQFQQTLDQLRASDWLQIIGILVHGCRGYPADRLPWQIQNFDFDEEGGQFAENFYFRPLDCRYAQ